MPFYIQVYCNETHYNYTLFYGDSYTKIDLLAN